nr:PREDICTED: molybdopterin synthase sulfur carrier subunit [Bemisia tabaci]
MSVSVRILFFGLAKDLSGEKETQIIVPSSVSRQDLLKDLVSRFSLQAIESIITLAVNEEYILDAEEINLKNGDQLAIIPPLSGG